MLRFDVCKVAATVGVAGAFAVGGIVTVSAHANTVSFASDCSKDGLHKTVTATIVNDFNETETATRTGQTHAVFTPLSVAIAASPDPHHLSTGTMKAVVAGSATGPVSLTVHGVWQPDGYAADALGTGTLGEACPVPTPEPTPTPTATPRATPTPTATPKPTATPTATPTPTPTPAAAGAVSAVTASPTAVTAVPATGAGPFLQLGGLLIVAGTGLLVAVTRRRRHRTER